MNDEQKRFAEEIATYCQDGVDLGQCPDWAGIETWLTEATTEPWHEHENLTPLKGTYGDDAERARERLLIEYIAKNIARRYIAFRNAMEYERLEQDKKSGVIDPEQFHKESQELSKIHTRLYEHLDL